MKVKHIGFGTLTNNYGEYFSSEEYGNLINIETGEIYIVTKRDEYDNIVEIERM